MVGHVECHLGGRLVGGVQPELRFSGQWGEAVEPVEQVRESLRVGQLAIGPACLVLQAHRELLPLAGQLDQVCYAAPSSSGASR